MARFELLGGAHDEVCPKTGKVTKYQFQKGKFTVVQSDRDLVAMFGAGHFRRLEDGRGHDSAPPAEPQPAEIPAPPGEAEATDPEVEPEVSFGKDVTAEFKGAAEAGLLVFQDDKGKYVTAVAAEPGVKLFGPVESKNEVRSFVKKHALSQE